MGMTVSLSTSVPLSARAAFLLFAFRFSSLRLADILRLLGHDRSCESMILIHGSKVKGITVLSCLKLATRKLVESPT